MDDSQYRDFEDLFRGSKELIKVRLSKYLPLVEEVLETFDVDANKILDLGSGRNEWLELLSEKGFKVFGIDASESMSATSSRTNFTVINGDILQELSKFSDESFTLITGFHVMEHLAPDELDKLLKKIKSKLKPGGLLIFETPNPSNLFVASHNFNLDVSHLKPLPSQLTRFLVESANIGPAATVAIHGAPAGAFELSLVKVLQDSSQDYVLVALREEISEESRAKLDSLVRRHLGMHTALEAPEEAATFDIKLASYISKNAELLDSIQSRIKILELNQEKSLNKGPTLARLVIRKILVSVSSIITKRFSKNISRNL